jgi:hypothetical protein
MTTPSTVSTGIPDPDAPDRWLVRPWPVRSSFCEVVRHFLTAYVGRLEGAGTVRQLAYFEGCQAALEAAPTNELTHPTTWRWHDELLGCVEDCVTRFRDKLTTQGRQAMATGRQSWAGAPAAIPTHCGRERA